MKIAPERPYRFIVVFVFCVATVFPIVLLHTNSWFYQLIGNRYPSRFFGLILFSAIMGACGVIATAKKSARQKRAFWSFSVLLWSFLGLVAIDIWYRLTDDRIPPTGWHIKDPILKSRYKPNLHWEGWFLGDQTRWDWREKRYVVYRTNRSGFRSEWVQK